MAKETNRKQSTFERLTSGKLNRGQRKDLKQRLQSDTPRLEVIQADAAGIDIGNESHFVAVAPEKDPHPVREFGSWTGALNELAEWLQSCGVKTVAMQSTGVYCIALYDVLEKHGPEVLLVNARRTKNVPGRKSDVQECEWLGKRHTYGLLRNSFRPPEQIRALRTVWRVRDRHVKEAGRCVRHMRKALTEMNVQRANAIGDLSGVSGQAILRAIPGGERDPYKLAALRDRRIAASEEEIARSLEGTWQEDLLFELRQAVEAYAFQQRQLAECDRQLQIYLAKLPTHSGTADDGTKRTTPPADPGSGREPDKKKKRENGRPSRNAPKSFDLAAELTRVCGVDATRIDGVEVMTVQTVAAEPGTDLKDSWPTEYHFASWLNLCRRRDISGGKAIRHTSEKTSNRVAAVLRMAASSLFRSDSYPGARYRHLRTRLGAPKAIKAMARYLGMPHLPPVHPRPGVGRSRSPALRAETRTNRTLRPPAKSHFHVSAPCPGLPTHSLTIPALQRGVSGESRSLRLDWRD
jgi:transposase